MEENPKKPIVNLPRVNEKHIACVCLGIVAVSCAWLLGDTSVPIVTGCAGSIGGLITGDHLK